MVDYDPPPVFKRCGDRGHAKWCHNELSRSSLQQKIHLDAGSYITQLFKVSGDCPNGIIWEKIHSIKSIKYQY